MTSSTRNKPLPEGIVPPLMTPLLEDGRLDEQGMAVLVEHLIQGGVNGLFLLGTCGEGPALPDESRMATVKCVSNLLQDRLSFLVSVGHTSLNASLQLARHAADCGATAVSFSPPCYYPMAQDDLYQAIVWFQKESPLPVMLYDIPSHAHTAIEVDTIRRAMDLPNVVGLKDSSGQDAHLHAALEMARSREDWSVWVGSEQQMVDAIAGGAKAVVAGGALIFPAAYTALFKACRSGDQDRVRALRHDIESVAPELFTVGQTPSSLLRGIKLSVQETLGLQSGRLAAPIKPFTGEERVELLRRLDGVRQRLEIAMQSADLSMPVLR